jgi:hypothetical protein
MRFVILLLILISIAVIIFTIVIFLNQKNHQDKTALISPLSKTQTTSAPSFSIENAPSESIKGKITEMQGEISWQSRTATEASKIDSPIDIKQGEKLVTGEKSSLSLELADACTVDLLEKTELEIVQTLPANIVFSQTGGQAEYLKTGNYPISVRLKSLLVQIDGDLMVTFDPDMSIIKLSLKSGNAIVAYNDLYYVSHELNIKSGQTLSFNYDTRQAALK